MTRVPLFQLVVLLTAAVLAAASPVHPAKLSLNYLPPTKPYQPPADSYLPPPANSYLPPPSNSYLPPSFARRSGNVEDNLVEDVEPEEAGVEEGPAEAAVVAEVAPETPNETEAPVEEAVVEDAAVEEEVVGSEVVDEAGSDSEQPKFTPFYEDEQTEADSLKVSEHGGSGLI